MPDGSVELTVDVLHPVDDVLVQEELAYGAYVYGVHWLSLTRQGTRVTDLPLQLHTAQPQMAYSTAMRAKRAWVTQACVHHQLDMISPLGRRPRRE
jgi:hypothetical protein